METNIWNQIKESLKAEYQKIIDNEVSNFQSIIERLIDSNLPIRDFFMKLNGKNYVNNEYYRDIMRHDLVISENKILKKSISCDSIILKIAQYYAETLEWKLKKSVYQYVAGIEMKSINKEYFNIGPNGIEGRWSFVTDKNETGSYDTKTIIASGPIVRAHYRYISNISGKVSIDNTQRAKALKAVLSEKPKIVFNSKEEKELSKRIKAAEGAVRSAKFTYDRVKKELESLSKESSELTKVQKEFAEEEKYFKKKQAELDEVKAIPIEIIRLELELKADKKRIKEIKDTLNSYSMKKLKDQDRVTYDIKANVLLDELNIFYNKYPDIKKRDVKAEIKELKNLIELRQTVIRYHKNKKDDDFKAIQFIREKEKEIAEYQTKLDQLTSRL
jgi:hypothetical protein